MTAEWFAGSKKGLEKIARRRGLAYVVFELIQNAWDTGAREVKMTFEPVEGRPLCWVRIEDDDPDGFKDLAHAWTLFAESEKKGDPEKRGRFNLGEKLVLALCQEAEITSTRGNVRFDDEGRHVGRKRREQGTLFEGLVKMRRDELSELVSAGRRLIPPPGVLTTVGGEVLKSREPLRTFECSLQTEVADEEGALVSRQRRTAVRVYSCAESGSEGWIYEMGIPVCQTNDPWDVEIMQKVPVDLDRQNVSEAYLRSVRVHVLNSVHDLLRKEDAARPAVQDALTDGRIVKAAVDTVLTHQYGEKRAIFDPSDLESNHRLTAAGYKIIHGGAFSGAAWDNIRTHESALPGGQILPTPKPYSDDPNAKMRELLPESEWSDDMRSAMAFAVEFGWKLLHVAVRVNIDKGRMNNHAACYGSGELTFSLPVMGRRNLEVVSRGLIQILIHEFAHHYGHSHLDDKFHKGLERLGAQAVELALSEPEFFKKYNWRQS